MKNELEQSDLEQTIALWTKFKQGFTITTHENSAVLRTHVVKNGKRDYFWAIRFVDGKF